MSESNKYKVLVQAYLSVISLFCFRRIIWTCRLWKYIISRDILNTNRLGYYGRHRLSSQHLLYFWKSNSKSYMKKNFGLVALIVLTYWANASTCHVRFAYFPTLSFYFQVGFWMANYCMVNDGIKVFFLYLTIYALVFFHVDLERNT